ncbi:hypothetical protein JQ628_24155 [Bradyrhizobium lablabi]|uniref:hypothetical protein n=1 Tax=Bradyrhizobium lablabi TaxID=722472 RepID=UPI001BA46A89|nr:hypothetical protein [Bradyrhizobium lablabi]MBR1124638.1 hypothetical protein [Bradyrhizobium lablabi]
MNLNTHLIAAALSGVMLIFGNASALFATENTISQAGRSASPQPSRFAAVGPDCEIAQPNSEHLFVAVAVDHGDALTNIQLDNPAIKTTMVRVVVDAGARPITILLQSGDPVIWDFEGAVERIARAIVVPGYRNRVAMRGLPAERVDFLKLARCPAQSIPLKNDPKNERDEILRGLFGRLPDRMAFASEPNSIRLPELKAAEAPKSAPRTGQTQAEKDLALYYPGGFRIVEPNSLLSPAQVFTPETFPNQAGLIQLERAGAIRPALREEVDRFVEGYSKQFRSKLDPTYRLRVGFSYVVLRDLMFPVGGLGGGHAKSFLVLPGVPAPRGNAGHGCLAFMDGFRADELSCLGDDREAIQRLRKLPDDEAAKACRLFDAPDDATVEAVSIYKPRASSSPVEIHVGKRGAVLLVLNTYEPAIWRISTGEGARIAGIIMTSYYPGKVEGIPPDTPVINLYYRGRNNRLPAASVCAPLQDYLGAYSGGPAAIVLDRQISALTGKNIDKLRFSHELDSIEIR